MSSHTILGTDAYLSEVSHHLWNYWSESQAPERFEPLQTANHWQIATKSISSWTIDEQRGFDYAEGALVAYLAGLNMPVIPVGLWQWQESPRLESRCARLQDGHFRVASPVPIDVAGVMLLVHELAHAALEYAQPGSLANTEHTEQFAIAAELFTARWLLSRSCNDYLNLALAQAIMGWLALREHEFQIQHSVLAEFEWLLWQAVRAQSVTASWKSKEFTATETIDTAWHSAHNLAGLTCVPLGWSRIPLILQNPGNAHVYRRAWVKARSRFSQSNLFKEWVCVA